MPSKIIDPSDFHLPGDDDNTISKEERELIHTLVFRRWMPFLEGSEFKIVAFIYDRTVVYNRRRAYVSVEALQHGYPFKDDRGIVNKLWESDRSILRKLTPMERSRIDEGEMFLTAPTGLSRRQIMRSLPTLIERGFVYRSGTRQEPELGLNPDAYFDYTQIFWPR